MADGEEGEGEGEEGEKRLVDLRRSSLMASPQVKNKAVSKSFDTYATVPGKIDHINIYIEV